LPRYVKILLHKELLDLWRDRKTLFTSILLPLIMLPILGLTSIALVSQQPTSIAVVDLDRATATNQLINLTIDSRWMVNNLTKYLQEYGYNVTYSESTEIMSNPYIDVIVVIPERFAYNASSLNLTSQIIVYRKTGYQSAIKAENTIYSIVSVFSYNISSYKLRALSRLAGVEADLDSLRNPVKAYTELITVRGERVTIEVELKNTFARVLVLALSFVVTPAASYVIDGIIGERERKTIEFLLASPSPLSHIIYSKMIAASILGVLTALFDALGLVFYMITLTLAMGASVGLVIDYTLLIIHAVAAFFTILSTITIALPFITRTRGIRSASNIASIVTIMGIVFFFTGFFIDYVKLPAEILYPLYVVPYVHSILIIQSYMLEDLFRSILHVLFLAIVSIALLIITTKTVNSEKLLIAPS